MQIPFEKINKNTCVILAVTASILFPLNAWTQETDTSPSPAPTSASASSSPGTEPSSSGETATALDYLMNRKPQDGSAAKQVMSAGKRAESRAIAEDAIGIPRTEDPEIRARFERYLGMPPVPQETLDRYFSNLKNVSNVLQENQIFEAWKLLHLLAEETIIDASISRELANRVESIWNMDRATINLGRKNEQIRKDIKTANHNADLISKDVREQELEYQRRLKQRQSQPSQSLPSGGVPQNGVTAEIPSVAGLEGKLQLTEEYLRSLELKAKIKLNELKQEKLLEQAKADFSEYISTLFNSGRLNHVVLAADFYRKIFQEGEYPADMGTQVNAALEINRDVQTAVEVFRYKIERNQLVGASDSLQEAFMTSELHPAVLGLDRTLKEKVADFLANLDQMRNLIEARDFGNLETLLQNIKESATDFDTTKPMAIVNAVKLESKMRLGRAKLAAQQGNLEKAMEEFQTAAETWPGNPDLEDRALTFFDTQDIQSQTLVEFDRLVKEQNYREIFDKQIAFAPALRDDKERQHAMKQALEAIKDAEMASEKANLMMMNGDAFGAWETIELAIEKLPDDKKLNRLRADLTSKSAEFVSAINKAKSAESKNEWGYSLTWYVNAQRQYPASRFANEGIERLSKKLLQTQGANLPSNEESNTGI